MCPKAEVVFVELEVTKNGAPVWFRITGAKGVKEFLRAELQL